MSSATPPPSHAAAPVKWLSAEEQQVWRALLCTEARLQERLDQELRSGHGLSMADYGVLVHLSEGPAEGMRMSELAQLLTLSRSGLTRRIDSLVRAGLVARRSCPFDGRGTMAQLTDAGRQRLEEAAPTHVTGVRRYLVDALGGDLSGLASGLARVAAALDR
jgi:DNA-binding MarR family transcriptional regulator